MGTVNNYGNVLLAAGSNTIDVQALLNSALAAAQQPLTTLQQQQTTLQIQTATMQNIQGDVNSLASAVSDLGNAQGAINSFTTATSNSNILTATADTTALAGAHSIVVNSLATTSSVYTDAVASGTTAIAAGTFQIAVGANPPATVTIDNTDNTLNGLAAAINTQGLGVTASVINDANGARLAIVSNTSGAAGNIAISANTTSLNFNQAATGANASLTVDGIPIISTSNIVSTVIPGVTLNLNGANPNTTVNLTLTPDIDQATKAINQFVTTWNKVVQDLNAQFTVASDGTGGGPLEGDNTLRLIQNQLFSAVNYSIGGNNGFVNLASIGVNMNNDGTLSVNSATLSNTLGGNYQSVRNLLQGTSGLATYLSSAIQQIADPSQGTITIDLQGMSQVNQDLTNQINTLQTQLNTQKQYLTSQYAQMEATLQEMPLLQSQVTQQLTALKGG